MAVVAVVATKVVLGLVALWMVLSPTGWWKVKDVDTLKLMMTQESKCRSVKDLGECVKDEGTQDPQHLQSVYLGSTSGLGWWWYPTADGWVRDWQHDVRTLTETEHGWARWIWHDCGEDTVCLESAKYPHHYLYTNRHGNLAISYSPAPQSEDWTRMRVAVKQKKERGTYMQFVSERYYRTGYRKGLAAYLYIPPRCEGFRKVADHSNHSPEPISYVYSYEKGVTRKKGTFKTTTVGVSMKMEAMGGIVKGGINFQHAWTSEESTTVANNQVHHTSINIPPGKHLVVWQRVATYGPYEWRSAMSFVICMTDVTRGTDNAHKEMKHKKNK